MRFEPATKDDLEIMKLLSEGSYNYEIVSAEDKVSKAGSEMIVLQLRIYDENDKPHVVFDYLLPAMMHKLLHFCESARLNEEYKNGLLSAQQCLGKKGSCDIIIQKDKTGKYPPKNSVRDYILHDQLKLAVEAPTNFKDDLLSDDLPF